MGILDDAIREHLDLKRRLGAEDEEIVKLESEAFGPPSRPDDPDFADPPSADPAAVEAPAPQAEAMLAPAEEAAPPQSPAMPEPAPSEPPTGTDEQPALEPEPVAEPPIESFDTVEHHFEGAIEETGEAEVLEGELEEEAASPEPGSPEPGTGEEDVLEETPEFLRDQPEDDELWFEQGEPKDFDF